jgi:hypothetical protein
MMARQAGTYRQIQGVRLPFPGGVYHVTASRNECNAIVREDTDHWEARPMTLTDVKARTLSDYSQSNIRLNLRSQSVTSSL